MSFENKKVVLQASEREGNIGYLWYGVDGSDPKTWEHKVVTYDKPVVRSRKECQAEQKRLMLLDVYDDVVVK